MKSFAVLSLASCLTVAVVTAAVYPAIDPYSIDDDTKETWCTQQEASCESLCHDEFQGVPDINECYVDDLQYFCICPDGHSPSASEYSLWIPYQLCILSVQECSDNCDHDAACSEDCYKKQCGSQNPTTHHITTTTSTPTPTTTGSQSRSPSSSRTGAHASPTANVIDNLASSLTKVASFYGFGAIVVGMAVGFFLRSKELCIFCVVLLYLLIFYP